MGLTAALYCQNGETVNGTACFPYASTAILSSCLTRVYRDQWEQRWSSRKPLAQAIHVWLCSHDRPYPITVEYLHDITGSNTKNLKHFRARLKAALDELISVGVLADWHLTSGIRCISPKCRHVPSATKARAFSDRGTCLQRPARAFSDRKHVPSATESTCLQRPKVQKKPHKTFIYRHLFILRNLPRIFLEIYFRR